MIKKEELEGFGKVEICQEIEEGFEIKLTKGFSGQANRVFTFMSKINHKLADSYPRMKKLHAEEGMFHGIYTKGE
jgi:hypothetical protein